MPCPSSVGIVERMFEGVVEGLDQRDAELDAWLATDLSALDAATLLEVTRRWEVQDRRAGALRHRLVGEVESRGLAR